MTFEAAARGGYSFKHWEKGSLCSESKNPVCTVSAAKLTPEMLASGTLIGHLRPVFVGRGGERDIMDTVIVNGKEWAQPFLFFGGITHWGEFLVACPFGVCRDDAVIDGYRQGGWQLASQQGAYDIMVHCFGDDYFDPGKPNYSKEVGSPLGYAFLQDWDAFYGALLFRSILLLV